MNVNAPLVHPPDSARQTHREWLALLHWNKWDIIASSQDMNSQLHLERKDIYDIPLMGHPREISRHLAGGHVILTRGARSPNGPLKYTLGALQDFKWSKKCPGHDVNTPQ